MEDKNEIQRLRKYTSRMEIGKAVSTLNGILVGIALDSRINKTELDNLNSWCNQNYDLLSRQPFAGLIEKVRSSLADGVLTSEEYEDIQWFTRKVLETDTYFDLVTKELQFLHGMLFGIMSDNKIEEAEVRELKKWLFQHEELTGHYPFDELLSLVTSVLRDGKIDEDEEKILKAYFSEFADINASPTIDLEELDRIRSEVNIKGVCALGPDVTFENQKFCFTGVSERAKRSEIAKVVQDQLGLFSETVTKDTNYLIFGSGGNPLWAYSCYGRKIEKAIELRKSGYPILIVHEIDFWDALPQ